MATYTSNYGWTKPSGSDNVDISVLNNNLDDQDSTIHDAFLNMAPPFSESSTYAVDDIVLYTTGLYKCHTPVVTPGSWTGSTNWQVYKLSEGGSGGGGTSNYNQLTNKPQINSVELSGNKTAGDLGLASTTDLANKVDKEAGKGLSTNDYTNTDKAEVAKVANKAEKTATASGETLALAPTSEGKALIHTAYGMSVQNGTPTPSVPVDIESAKADFISTDGENTQNVTTDLTLRAIEVSSTDNYNLIRDNKYYISDTLDYSEDNGFVVTRRIKESVIDGSQSITTSYDGHTMTVNDLYTTSECISFLSPNNRFKAIDGNSTNLADANSKLSNGECIKRNTKQSIAASDYFKNTSMTSASDWATWLTSNPITVYDILATPTTENITTEQALALLGLKTYDESTTISSQAEPACTIAVEYAKERLGALALTAYNTAKGNDLRITALEG